MAKRWVSQRQWCLCFLPMGQFRVCQKPARFRSRDKIATPGCSAICKQRNHQQRQETDIETISVPSMEGFKEKIREMERLVFTIKIHQICLACVFRGPANLSLNQFYSNNTSTITFFVQNCCNLHVSQHLGRSTCMNLLYQLKSYAIQQFWLANLA